MTPETSSIDRRYTPMKQRTIIFVIALATMLVTAGAAMAAPGNAPDHVEQTDGSNEADVGSDNPNEMTDENATDGNTMADKQVSDTTALNEDASDRDERAANAQGPPADLPSQVPDFVSQMHDVIGQFLDGEYDGSLGDTINDVTPGNESDTEMQ